MRRVDELPGGTYQYKILKDSGKLCTKLFTKEDVNEWMIALETKTKETWIIEKTYTISKKFPRNSFKRIYKCHLKINPKQKQKVMQKNTLTNDCPARLIVTIKKLFKSRNSEIMNEWPCVLNFINTHNHDLNDPQVLRKRHIGPDALRELKKLYDNNCSAAESYHIYCNTIKGKLGEDYKRIAKDRFYIPSKKDVNNLFEKTFSKPCKTHLIFDFKKTADKFKESSILCELVEMDNKYALALCTPIMQRVLDASPNYPIMFVERLKCDVNDIYIYMFTTVVTTLPFPVGCLMTNNVGSLNDGIKALFNITNNKILPLHILLGEGCDREIFEKNWPQASIVFSVQYTLNLIESWGNEKLENVIQKLYLSPNIKDLKEVRKMYFLDSLCLSDENKSFFNNIESWSNLYRPHMMESCINNFTEVLFHSVKYTLQENLNKESIEKYTLNFITSIEKGYVKTVEDILSSNKKSEFIIKCTNDVFHKYDVKENLKRNGQTHQVSMLNKNCSCNTLKVDPFQCTHLDAVMKNVLYDAANEISENDKVKLWQLVTGSNGSPAHLLSHNITVSRETSSSPEMLFALIVNDENFFERLNDLKRKWVTFSDSVLSSIDEDPAGLCPAVEVFLNKVAPISALQFLNNYSTTH